ncbi:MAG: sulfatase-like hydrolase/transferase [Bacteroidetes bacterium]|nr:sulfatase-like hydrolase/transferase [Bacteroidota bacterium]
MNNRICIKKFGFFVISFFVFGVSIAQNPNIVVILVDDAGNKDWGFQGSSISITPNIDQLASEGTVFTQGYVTNSVCSPSRAGMLSGQYQNKFGFEYNIVAYSEAPFHTSNDVGMDVGIKTMGNYLQDLGYKTGLFGKWHLGEKTHHRPNERGFDHFYGLLKGSRQYNKRETSFNKKLLRNGVDVEPSDDNFYLTDLLTDEALWYINTEVDAGNPFLAFMSYTAPHGPFQAKPEDKALFDNVAGLTSNQKNYYGMIKNVDDNVKRIVDLLKQKNQYENTLFIFLSDNGGVKLIADNGVLRGNKSSQYEGGLRVPFFMTWKNNVPTNNTYNKQVISLDLTTTFIKAAGGDLNDVKYEDLDGKDLVTVANNTTNTLHDNLFWRKLDIWAIVSDGTNKIIFNDNHNFSPAMVDTVSYNLSTDISETTNVYESNKESLKPLVEAYNTWNATLDVPNWYGDGISDNVCGSGVVAQDCQILIDRYNAFYGIDPDPSDEIKIEAESGTLSGEATDVGNCSGNASGSIINLKTGSATYTVNVESSGNYLFKVSSVTNADKNLTVNVNGAIYEIDMVLNSNNKWCYEGGLSALTSGVNIPLDSGDNTIVLTSTDTAVSVDYFTVAYNSALSIENLEKPNFNIIVDRNNSFKIINAGTAKILNIYNMLGQQFKNKYLTQGLYLIRIEKDQKMYVKKVFLK